MVHCCSAALWAGAPHHQTVHGWLQDVEEPAERRSAVISNSGNDGRSQAIESFDRGVQASGVHPAVKTTGPLAFNKSSPIAVSTATGHVAAASGVANLPVLGSSNKVQEWLSSSISDVDAIDPGGAASSSATPAGGTRDSNGLLCESPAVDGHSGDARRGYPVAPAIFQDAGASPVQLPAPPIKVPLPGQAADSSSSAGGNEVEGPSQTAYGHGVLPHVPFPSVAEERISLTSDERPPPHLLAQPHATSSRLAQQRFPATASAPVNSAAGIDNVLSLLRQHTEQGGQQRRLSHESVLQGVSAAVSSLHSTSASTPVEAPGRSEVPARTMTDAELSPEAPSRAEPVEDPLSLLSMAGTSANPAPPGIYNGSVNMPDMHKQIAKMFLNGDTQAPPGGSGQGGSALGSDAQQGWSPPSLAINEQDGMSSCSSMSIITPLRMHADAAVQPYQGAPQPAVESDRMGHLCSLNILGTSPERRFDRLTGLAATVRLRPLLLCATGPSSDFLLCNMQRPLDLTSCSYVKLLCRAAAC